MDITILAVAMIVLAAALVGVGLAGLTERLPRNRWIGVRVASVQASDEAWRAGHRAASGAVMAAAGPPLLLAVALIASPPEVVDDWLLVYIVVGVVTGGLIALAVRQADRAAQEVNAE
jgi:hypothetical protein